MAKKVCGIRKIPLVLWVALAAGLLHVSAGIAVAASFGFSTDLLQEPLYRTVLIESRRCDFTPVDCNFSVRTDIYELAFHNDPALGGDMGGYGRKTEQAVTERRELPQRLLSANGLRAGHSAIIRARELILLKNARSRLVLANFWLQSEIVPWDKKHPGSRPDDPRPSPNRARCAA